MDGQSIIFEDGVRYTMREALVLAKATPGDLRELHEVKARSRFECTILEREK